MSERKHMNADTRDAFVLLYATGMTLRQVQDHMVYLSRRARNFQRRIRMAQSLLLNLSDEIMKTITPEQLLSIKQQMEGSYIKIARKDAGKPDNGTWVMTRDELSKLVQYAVENNCVLCDGKQKCELRRLLRDVPVSIENTHMMACKGGGLKGV